MTDAAAGPEDEDWLVGVIRSSLAYRSVATLRRWAAHSTAAALLSNDRVLQAAALVFVLASAIRVSSSSLHTGLKFASFVVVFVVVTALLWPSMDRETE